MNPDKWVSLVSNRKHWTKKIGVELVSMKDSRQESLLWLSLFQQSMDVAIETILLASHLKLGEYGKAKTKTMKR